MAADKQPRHREEHKRQVNVEGGRDKQAGANPPNQDAQRPAAPGGSGGGSETGQGKPNK